MLRQSARKAFAPKDKQTLADFPADVQSDCRKVLANPATATVFGETVCAAAKSAADQAVDRHGDAAAIIARCAQVMTRALAVQKEAKPGSLSEAAIEQLGLALEELKEAVTPLRQLRRLVDSLPVFRDRLNDYAAAAKLLPQGKRLTGRISFLEGSAQGLKLLSSQLKTFPGMDEVRDALCAAEPVLKNLSEQRKMAEALQEELRIFTEGTRTSVSIRRPLQLLRPA